jgi:heme exporter protein B
VSQFRAFLLLVGWEWRFELRRKDTLVSMALMALITLFLFSFAIDPLDDRVQAAMPTLSGGILWVTFVLAGTIGIDRAFRGDGDGRLLEALLIAPVTRATVYYAKVAATFAMVVLVAAVTLLLFFLLFNRSTDGDGLLIVGLAAFLGILGFVELGILLSAMTWSVAGGDVLLRILLFPMLIPVFYAAVSLTSHAFDGKPPTATELLILASFDVVFLGVGHLLFEHLVRE